MQIETDLRYLQYYVAIADFDLAISLAKKVVETIDSEQYADSLTKAKIEWGYSLFQQSKYEEGQKLVEEALESAKRLKTPIYEAECLTSLGIAAEDQGKFELARQYFDHALAISQEINDIQGEGWILNNLGLTAWHQNEYQTAEVFYDQALRCFKETGDPRGESVAVNNQGLLALDNGKFDTAEKIFEEVLEIGKRIKNVPGEILARNNLAIVAHNRGDYVQVVEQLEHALKLSRQIGDRMNERMVLNNLGASCIEIGDYEKADEYCNEALSISQETGEKLGEAYCLTYLGRLAEKQGQFDKAVSFAEKGKLLAKNIQAKTALADNWNTLGFVYAALGKTAEAKIEFEECVSLRQELNQTHFLPEPLSSLAYLAQVDGDFQGAKQLLDAVREIPQESWSIDTYLNMYKTLKSRNDKEADVILKKAYLELNRKANNIKDLQGRQRYLENIKSHQLLHDLMANLD